MPDAAEFKAAHKAFWETVDEVITACGGDPTKLFGGAKSPGSWLSGALNEVVSQARTPLLYAHTEVWVSDVLPDDTVELRVGRHDGHYDVVVVKPLKRTRSNAVTVPGPYVFAICQAVARARALFGPTH